MEFDYLIVGAGSAGCVLANRLSAGGKYTVALLEAGGRDSSPWIHIPVGYFKTMGNPRFDWCFQTEPDPGLNGRSIPWPRGKVLGGSSSINGLLYVRGQAEDFDHWRQLGNTGWAWTDVEPLFRRLENWEGAPSEARGQNGPLTVSRSRLTREIVDSWIAAACKAGFEENPDYNGPSQEGVGYYQLTARNGRRVSSAAAYLKPAMHRQNLTVLTKTQATGVLVDNHRAVGVTALQENGEICLRARHEVILCAGAIVSPHLLMLSGIGDGQQLSKVGVPVRHHLPGVGRNLQDHLQARPVYKCSLPTVNTEISSIFKQGMIAAQYAISRSGPMTMAASLGYGFLKTRPELDTPDIQFHVQPWSADSPAEGPHKFSAFTASVLQLRPESAGHLELTAPDVHTPPAIHPNYLATPLDCQTLVDGIKIARRISQQNPLTDVITEEHSPGPVIGDNDDDAILDWARNTATTIYHPTGTCKMGSDPGAVVDEKLKVHGIDRLRIADASIMPVITSGNTNAPCIMIGEKAAEMILESA